MPQLPNRLFPFLFLIWEMNGFGGTWPRDTRSSVPEAELSVSAVHVASFAFQTLVVTNEQVTLLSQFVHQLRNGKPNARFLNYHQGFEFVDVACCTTFLPRCLLVPEPRRLATPIPMRSAFFGFAFQVRVTQPSSSQRVLSKHVVPKPILLCVIT